MQLQQSGYRLSKTILSNLPKPVLLLFSIITLSLIFTNTFLVLQSKPKLNIDQCLQKYNDLTHANISQFLQQQVYKNNNNSNNNNNNSNNNSNNTQEKYQPTQSLLSMSMEQINEYIKFINESTILSFQIDNNDDTNQLSLIKQQKQYDTQQCMIQLNYNHEKQQKQQQNYITLGYMVSNQPIFNFNLSDPVFLRKHNIGLHRIILNSKLYHDVGYRYIGMNKEVNFIQDFIYALNKGMEKLQINKISKWEQELVRLSKLIKQEQEKYNQVKKKQGQQEANKVKKQKETNISSVNNNKQNKTQTISKQNQNETKVNQQNTQQQQIISIEQQKNKTLSQVNNTFKGVLLKLLSKQQKIDMKNGNRLLQTSPIPKPQNKTTIQNNNKTAIITNNTKTSDPLLIKIQKQKQKYLLLLNMINLSLMHPSYFKHKILYHFPNNVNSKFYGHMLSSVPPKSKIQTSKIFNLLIKIGTIVINTMFLFFQFFVIGLFVRYLYIVVMTILGMIFKKSIGRHIGWMTRYSNLYNKNNANQVNQRKQQDKIILRQVGFSFICTYGLYMCMTYLLSSAFTSVLVSFQILPSPSLYSETIFITFLLIQISHYIFFRSRTALSFFPKFSLLSTMLVTLVLSNNPYFLTSYFLNTHLLINLLLIFMFMFIEKSIIQQQFQSGNRPTLQKPRMLFYLGYDLDWHKNVPPIWTYFQPWFDYSYVSEQERCYIEQNYELLYGRLLGVNQPQQLPQDQEQEDQDQRQQLKEIQMSQSSY